VDDKEENCVQIIIEANDVMKLLDLEEHGKYNIQVQRKILVGAKIDYLNLKAGEKEPQSPLGKTSTLFDGFLG